MSMRRRSIVWSFVFVCLLVFTVIAVHEEAIHFIKQFIAVAPGQGAAAINKTKDDDHHEASSPAPSHSNKSTSVSPPSVSPLGNNSSGDDSTDGYITSPTTRQPTLFSSLNSGRSGGRTSGSENKNVDHVVNIVEEAHDDYSSSDPPPNNRTHQDVVDGKVTVDESVILDHIPKINTKNVSASEQKTTISPPAAKNRSPSLFLSDDEGSGDPFRPRKNNASSRVVESESTSSSPSSPLLSSLSSENSSAVATTAAERQYYSPNDDGGSIIVSPPPIIAAQMKMTKEQREQAVVVGARQKIPVSSIAVEKTPAYSPPTSTTATSVGTTAGNDGKIFPLVNNNNINTMSNSNNPRPTATATNHTTTSAAAPRMVSNQPMGSNQQGNNNDNKRPPGGMTGSSQKVLSLPSSSSSLPEKSQSPPNSSKQSTAALSHSISNTKNVPSSPPINNGKKTNMTAPATEATTSSATSAAAVIPPLSSLIQNRKVVGNVSRLLDFAIVGFPKSGTSSLLKWLERHDDEVQMAPGENSDLYFGRSDGLTRFVRYFYGQYQQCPRCLRGYKNPLELYRFTGIMQLERHFGRQTKIIVTIRHPIQWFQSYFNYRVQTLWGEKGNYKSDEKTLFNLDCDKTNGLCLENAKFHSHLYWLGKRNHGATDSAANNSTRAQKAKRERDLLGHDTMKYTPTYRKPVSNVGTVFLTEISQLSDVRVMDDISNFLGLQRPLRPGKTGNTGQMHSFDICQEKYDRLRGRLLDISKNASTWIREYFLPSDGVVVSSRNDLERILAEDWTKDPCVEKMAEAKAENQNKSKTVLKRRVLMYLRGGGGVVK